MKSSLLILFVFGVAYMAAHGQANTKLSNLAPPTAVNADLLPNSTNTRNLGSNTLGWKSIYTTGRYYINGGLFLHNKGIDNTFVGDSVGTAVTTGNYNTAMGDRALFRTTTGGNNTAFGRNVLYSNLSGYQNTASGSHALYSNTLGSQNTAFGYYALYNSTSGSNTASGAFALYSNTTGRENTAFGVSALYENTTGSQNTALGILAGVFPGNLTNATALGYYAKADASNKVRIGNTSVTRIGGQVSWSTFSDGRYKRNIKYDVQGLAFINSLRPITYTVDIVELNAYYNKGRHQPEGARHDETIATVMKKSIEQASKIVYNGFNAQEVEEAANKLNYKFSGIDKPETEDGLYGLRYADFIVPLVKAVQELAAKDKKLEEENKLKDERITQLEKELIELRQMVLDLNKGNSGNGNNALKAYLKGSTPNPTSGAALIGYYVPQNSGTAHIVFTDMKGAIIKSITLNNKGTGQVAINVGSWTAGTYTYTLYVNGSQADNKKLVIAR